MSGGMGGPRATMQSPVSRMRAPRLRRCGICLMLGLPGLAGPAVANQWGAPKAQHWSANREYALKVKWGVFAPDGISLWRATDEGPRQQWSRGYVNDDRPPYMAYVANDGRHVVLRDAHGHLGYGKCLVSWTRWATCSALTSWPTS